MAIDVRLVLGVRDLLGVFLDRGEYRGAPGFWGQGVHMDRVEVRPSFRPVCKLGPGISGVSTMKREADLEAQFQDGMTDAKRVLGVFPSHSEWSSNPCKIRGCVRLLSRA